MVRNGRPGGFRAAGPWAQPAGFSPFVASPSWLAVMALRGAVMAVKGVRWVTRQRRPMSRQLDATITVLDRRRFAGRRSLFNRIDPVRSRGRDGQVVKSGRSAPPTSPCSPIAPWPSRSSDRDACHQTGTNLTSTHGSSDR